LGQEGFRTRCVAAGDVLAEAGAVPEALEAYCRGEDWERARGLLTGSGHVVAEGMSVRLDGLPPAMVLHDPWLLLASARRLRNEGRFNESIARYQRAESFFGSSEPAEICRSERVALTAWSGASSARPEPLALLRQALRSEPLGAARVARQQPPGAAVAIVAGLAEMLAGHAAAARRELLHAAERADAGRYAQTLAALAAGVAGLLMGQRHALVEVAGAVASAEAAGLDWLARLGRAALALSGSPEQIREAEAVAVACRQMGDDWGQAVARICAAWGALIASRPVTGTDRLVADLRHLDAHVLEAWMLGIAALAAVRAGEPEAHAAALTAEAAARTAGVDAARMLAHLALSVSVADDIEAEQYRSAAVELAGEIGLVVPDDADVGPAETVAAVDAPPLQIHMLGGFAMSLAGREVDLRRVRPRARALLRLLCLHAGAPVHHETIEAVLWPSADPDASSRNLHVAIAALRRTLEPAAGRGSFQLVRREGDAYRLALPVGSEVDLLRFEEAIRGARTAEGRGDLDRAVAAYQAALDMYRGELLPEDGPAEWVAERRDACRLAAVGAAQNLARLLLRQGDAAGAANACNIGLRIERYHDPLWRLLIEARDMAGDQGAASRARLGYDRMLAELGVQAPLS
jgi:DNA-binding SARP family transcriptional activator